MTFRPCCRAAVVLQNLNVRNVSAGMRVSDVDTELGTLWSKIRTHCGASMGSFGVNVRELQAVKCRAHGYIRHVRNKDVGFVTYSGVPIVPIVYTGLHL